MVLSLFALHYLNYMLQKFYIIFTIHLTDITELPVPTVEECLSTSYTAVGVSLAGGVVVGLMTGIVGTVTVVLVVLRKRIVKGIVCNEANIIVMS